MKRFPRFWRWAATMLAGGGVFVLNGCEPTIRDTVLGGLEQVTNGLATTVIQAIFIKLSQDNSTTTAMLRVIEDTARMLA